MKFTGHISNWDDAKSSGFITPSQGGEDIYVHISECSGGRPPLEALLMFEIDINPMGKKSAVNVTRAKVAGVDARESTSSFYGDDSAFHNFRTGAGPRRRPWGRLVLVIALLVVLVLGWQGYVRLTRHKASSSTGLLLPPVAATVCTLDLLA